jgi:hypothetical protein
MTINLLESGTVTIQGTNPSTLCRAVHLVISISRDLVLRSLFDQYQMQSSAAASTFFTLWADHRVDRVPATAFP